MARYEEALKTGRLIVKRVNLVVGYDCHFNGMRIKGDKRYDPWPTVTIGDGFHSGKNSSMRLVDHDWRNGLPYSGWVGKDIEIGDFVWLGEGVTVLKGVKIGHGAIIQYGSVVVSDIPECAIAGGHPAKPFSSRDKEDFYRRYEAYKEMKAAKLAAGEEPDRMRTR
ncbi:MAG: acyltransferase [Opitutales bacterium]